MELKIFLRNDFASYLRPKLLKESCEECGSKENLNVHHLKKFHMLFTETMLELDLDIKKVEEYTNKEINDIKHYMMSKQLRVSYKTLCIECHRKEHKGDMFRSDYYFNPYGSYFYIRKDILETTKDTTLLYFLILCCRLDFLDRLKFGNSKGETCLIHKRNLAEVCDVGRTQAHKIINEFLANNFVYVEDNIIKINRDIVFRGYREDKNKDKYACIFDKFIIDAYKNNKNKARIIPLILKLINNIDENNVIINKNNSTITRKEMAKVLSRAEENFFKTINKSVSVNILARDGNKLILNPALTNSLLFRCKRLKQLDRKFSELMEANKCQK